MFDWPFKKAKPVLSTMGEFRGSAPDITPLHSATDFFVGRGMGRLEVYSPDTGLVRRLKPAPGNPSAGKANIRVGHFGYNHIIKVLPDPGQIFRRNGKQLKLPENLPIYVQDAGDPAFAATKQSPRNDADFKEGKLRKGFPIIAYRRRGANDYQLVVFWPRDVPIGRGVSGEDLHCIYYTTADGPYDEGNRVGNALEVFRQFRNRKVPVAKGLFMYTQAGNKLFLGVNRAKTSAEHVPAMGGLDFKLFAHSPYKAKSGLYQLEYEIFNHLGNTTGRTNVYRFTTHPPAADSFAIVDKQLSVFTTPRKKETVYNLTSSQGGAINPANHWEVEKPAMWPDGCYAIKVWLKNIARPRPAGGGAVTTNEVLYGAEWTVTPAGRGKRKISVTDSFKKRPAAWVPRFKGCPGRAERVYRTRIPLDPLPGDRPGPPVIVRRTPIERVEGIGPTTGAVLRKAGVRSAGLLFARGADRVGRAGLARETGISQARIRTWVNRVDLMRVPGVGPQSAELLEAAGVDSVAELRHRKAAALAPALLEANRKKRVISRVPSAAAVERWIEAANTLGILVEL